MIASPCLGRAVSVTRRTAILWSALHNLFMNPSTSANSYLIRRQWWIVWTSLDLLLLACQRRPAAVANSASSGSAPEVSASAPRDTSGAAGILRFYDLTKPPSWQVRLPKALMEISGLAFTPDGRLFAHGDQDATIWQLDPRNGKVLKTFALATTGHDPDMGKRSRAKAGILTGDFEDIQVVGDRFFMISSTGMLVEFGEAADGAKESYTAYDTGLGRDCEIEGLTFDPSTRSLLLLCKHIYREDWRRHVVVAAWSVDHKHLEPAPRLRVSYDQLSGLTGARGFEGSAVTFAPDHRSLVLIAGPLVAFAELSLSGQVLRAGSLDRNAHRQPEGIAFAPDGTLLISDEGAGDRATLSGYAPHH
jgi:uncharacterized protein YjiK